VVIISGGRLVAERYGGADSRRGAEAPVGPDTTLLSWSMAESIVPNWTCSPGNKMGGACPPGSPSLARRAS
jgi:hypothetical protein